jgi:hypothetical protein
MTRVVSDRGRIRKAGALPPVLLAVAGLGAACGVAAGAGPAAGATAARHALHIVVSSPQAATAAFRVLATVAGRPTVWIARRGGATLLRFDQSRARLLLHAGTLDPGPGPYRHGPRIAGTERRGVLAAFNGGFRLGSRSGGFLENGHVALPLTAGLGSVVIYRDGRADVGAWHHGVPAAGRPVTSVRQNLSLLVAHARPAASAASCPSCWGATLGGGRLVARSGLGVTATGKLVWAGGEHLSPGGLATALIDGGAVRAVELDINPEWVAGYVYSHPGSGPAAEPVVPGQFGVAGRFLTAYSRDFFSVIAR